MFFKKSISEMLTITQMHIIAKNGNKGFACSRKVRVSQVLVNIILYRLEEI